jgi:hypothetical protein
MFLLSKTERAYLANKEQFSKRQQKDIRYRLNKKLRLLGEDFDALSSLDGKVVPAAEENSGGVAEFYDALLLHSDSGGVVRISWRGSLVDDDNEKGK